MTKDEGTPKQNTVKSRIDLNSTVDLVQKVALDSTLEYKG